MGIWEAFSDIVEAVTPWSVVEAEAPAEEQQVRESLVFRAVQICCSRGIGTRGNDDDNANSS